MKATVTEAFTAALCLTLAQAEALWRRRRKCE